VLRLLLLLLLVPAVLLGSMLLAYRFVDPPVSSLMVIRWLSGQSFTTSWRPLSRISPHLVRAVVAAEDARFCQHPGVDWEAIDLAIERAEEDGRRPRGASTITMQTVKNLMLWPQPHYVRKLIEIPLAYMADAWWGKPRVLELYLNIAEWGPGIFGAEAASRYHFGRGASELTASQAALLAASLPNPKMRRAGRPGIGLMRVARVIETRAMRSSPSCVLGRRAAGAGSGVTASGHTR
jgi:monofunctional biosynthetic peptidoglycan transglycosylase